MSKRKVLVTGAACQSSLNFGGRATGWSSSTMPRTSRVHETRQGVTTTLSSEGK